MAQIKIVIADSNYLSRIGLRVLMLDNSDFLLMKEVDNGTDLKDIITETKPHLLVVDYASDTFSLELVSQLKAANKRMQILSITNEQAKPMFLKALSEGVTSSLLKNCDKAEITEAIYKTAAGEKFLCAKILNIITSGIDEQAVASGFPSCEGLNISERELEIIRLVAEGYSNKEIAEKLFLSAHTVTTHRKNIMTKLNVNNTAGLVMFAVKQNLLGPNHFLFSSNN